MVTQRIAREKVPFEKKTEVQEIEDPGDLSGPQKRVETLLRENARAKRFMAEELSRIGFSAETIGRVLHVSLNTEETRPDHQERSKRKEVPGESGEVFPLYPYRTDR